MHERDHAFDMIPDARDDELDLVVAVRSVSRGPVDPPAAEEVATRR